MMGTIEQRLQALEYRCRRSQRVNRALALGLVTMFCIAGAQRTSSSDSKPKTQKIPQSEQGADQSQADHRNAPSGRRLRTIEADQFTLLDRLGRTRATLVATERGPALSLFDENGKKRVELSQSADASGVRLLDANESPLASLQVSRAEAQAQLEFADPFGKSITKASGFFVKDRDDHQRLLLALINGNHPVLGISQSGQNGPASVEITASDNGARNLRMHDQAGHLLLSAFAAENGATHLSMRHPQQERSLQISSGASDVDGPRIDFHAPANPDGLGGNLPFLQFGLRKNREPYIRIVDSQGNPVFTAPGK